MLKKLCLIINKWIINYYYYYLNKLYYYFLTIKIYELIIFNNCFRIEYRLTIESHSYNPIIRGCLS